MAIGHRPSAANVLMLLVVVLGGHVTAAPPDKANKSAHRVTIALRVPGRITSPILHVSDVAELQGGDEELRQQIAALDLEDAPLPGTQTEITPRHIEFRLRVAGIDPQLFAIRGSAVRVTTPAAFEGSKSVAKKNAEPRPAALFASHAKTRRDVSVTRDESEIEQAVLEAARKCLSKQLPWPEEKVGIQLAQPLPRELRERMVSTTTTCSAELRTSGTPLGRVALRVGLEAAGQRTVEVPVQVEVRHFEDVVVTTKPLARGHLFSSADLETDRQDVTLLSGYLTSPDQLVGQRAKRLLPESQVLRAVDVEPKSLAAEPPLVKRRDRVKATARSGILQVTIVGEALQEGRAGEVIKLKNLDSNREIYGRVLSATEVEVTE